ncbi:ABC transporter permease [Oleiagrimonas soli]|uniref:ABC transporter permease n=1 Tax=Oleiagrimonas soli TaxID=1543381 RepID=A0A099CYY3_9GAMM|nr:ABC transporter permease [Oleiagrimonas soli]KGI78949.1 ABC transporter permease [Oleiagrimonas soli]MBB6184542.1 sodium transport system permease protein [Oleiagrimonas soli]
MNATLTVFLKEVRENLRDRRTITSALVMGPLLGPFLFVMLMNVIINKQLDKAEKPLKVPVIGAQRAPNLVHALEQYGLVVEPAIQHPEAAVKQQLADVVLRIPASYPKAWNKGDPAQVEVIYDASRRDADTPVKRVKAMLEQYSRTQGAIRLLARGLSPAVSTPVVVAQRDQSTPQSRAGQLFAFMPYFFVVGVFIGGMYLAIDLTAGERERKSLEPLFVNPVARWRILLGKLGATAAFATASLVLSLVAFHLAGYILPTDKLGMSIDLGLGFAGTVLLLMLPLAALFASLQTLVSAFAKSYREAQTYLSILMLLPMLPSMILSFTPVKATNWMYAVPLLGQQLGITELLRGGSVTAVQVALVLVSGFLAALVAVLVTVRVYGSERLAISA